MARESTWLARTHARFEQWADAGWSNSVVFGWGLLQGCVFPGFADLFFLPLALARPTRAYRYALVATAGTLIGSIVLYFAGAEALGWLEGPVSRYFAVTPATINEYRATLATYGGWAIFASTMSPLSTKLTSIASGAAGVPFPQFVLALAAGRFTRTMVFAWLVRHGGAEAVSRFTKHRPVAAAQPSSTDSSTQSL
ncbi:YqaA family protein [Gemmatimonas sp.]|uniref:YqaA family protein n=1 Tax=Gemmatimonas sp. TaxID=1962908 RepID=UPI00356A51FF